MRNLVSVTVISRTGTAAYTPDHDDAPLARFEAEVWRVTGRKLTPLEVDRICIAHERAVERAVLAQLADGPPGGRARPRRVVPW